ncbi:MAG TPA: gliding motility-associated C-terminal domain-containing protein, partial [Salinimicrobium sp.]|nr:gliding motility-associated C-terminal domain-containing protein [Salinimicrobium sp.]
AVYYATQTSEGGCVSDAAMITVELTDAVTPSLVPEGDVFCDFDRPTISVLENNIVESGTITWYDAPIGGNVLSSSELLEDGVTYYATLVDETTGCESSQRLAVSITLEDCPLLIPEAFSPNGDGINDTFEIEHIGDEYPNFTIEIFNRWGNVVYTGNASTPEWDGVSTESGSLGDKVLPVGVYFYILNFNDGETAPIQGRLYLSR